MMVAIVHRWQESASIVHRWQESASIVHRWQEQVSMVQRFPPGRQEPRSIVRLLPENALDCAFMAYDLGE